MKSELSSLPKLISRSISFGADPEFFIEDKEGNIKGSEEVIPKDGIGDVDRVIRDGVQVELNPTAQTCRALFTQNVACALGNLEEKLKSTNFKISEKAVVKVDPDYLKSLSEEARALGCTPSLNTNPTTIAITKKDKNTTLRSAGGHIHLGVNKNNFKEKELVTMLDLFVGNTSVLLDRDPGQVERRKLYGRAGEYRLPKHGLEYRTPSNWWMITPETMGLVMGLTRMAWWISGYHNDTSLKDWNKLYAGTEPGKEKPRTLETENYSHWKEHSEKRMTIINGLLDVERIHKAINENDFDLALENHAITEHIIESCFQDLTADQLAKSNGSHCLSKCTLPLFRFFVEKGLNHWFKPNMFNNWRKFQTIDAHGHGWESFMYKTILPQYEQANKAKAA